MSTATGKDIHVVSMDVEAIAVIKKIYKYASEIIQIGAVLLDEGFNRKRGIKDDKNYIRQYM